MWQLVLELRVNPGLTYRRACQHTITLNGCINIKLMEAFSFIFNSQTWDAGIHISWQEHIGKWSVAAIYLVEYWRNHGSKSTPGARCQEWQWALYSTAQILQYSPLSSWGEASHILHTLPPICGSGWIRGCGQSSHLSPYFDCSQLSLSNLKLYHVFLLTSFFLFNTAIETLALPGAGVCLFVPYGIPRTSNSVSAQWELHK